MTAPLRRDQHTFGLELTDAITRLGSRPDDHDHDFEPCRPDLDQVARLARTAQRGSLDFFIADDTLGGLGPQSGRRRSGTGPLRFATRLAPASGPMAVVPRVRAAAIEPEKLLDGLVAVELASAGPLAWQLDLPSGGPNGLRVANLLTAVVRDAYEDGTPRTQIGSLARARRARGIREGRAAGLRGHDARPGVNGRSVAPVAPLLVVSAVSSEEIIFAAQRADIVRLVVKDMADSLLLRREIHAVARKAGRMGREPKVIVDLPTCVGEDVGSAEARREIVEAMTAAPLGRGVVWAGTAAGLAEMVNAWITAGACDGFTFLPTSLPSDLIAIVDTVMPLLQTYGVARKAQPQVSMSKLLSRTEPTAEPRVIGRAGVPRTLPTARPIRKAVPTRVR